MKLFIFLVIITTIQASHGQDPSCRRLIPKSGVSINTTHCYELEIYGTSRATQFCLIKCIDPQTCAGIVLDSRHTTLSCCILAPSSMTNLNIWMGNSVLLHHRNANVVVICDFGFTGEDCDRCAVNGIWNGVFHIASPLSFTLTLTFTGENCQQFTGKCNKDTLTEIHFYWCYFRLILCTYFATADISYHVNSWRKSFFFPLGPLYLCWRCM